MAFDEKLAERLRKQLDDVPGVVEKRMFGGIAFLLNGNMCVGVHQDALMVRLAPDATEAALRRAHARVFDLTGKPMKGWVLVGPEGIKTAASLRKEVGKTLATNCSNFGELARRKALHRKGRGPLHFVAGGCAQSAVMIHRYVQVCSSPAGECAATA